MRSQIKPRQGLDGSVTLCSKTIKYDPGSLVKETECLMSPLKLDYASVSCTSVTDCGLHCETWTLEISPLVTHLGHVSSSF